MAYGSALRLLITIVSSVVVVLMYPLSAETSTLVDV